MASDLFSEVSSRPPSVRSPRPAIVIVSIAGHGVVFLGALVFSLAAPGLLPTPRAALAFFEEQRRVRLIDIELPAPPRPRARQADAIEMRSSAPAIDHQLEAAPLFAATRITPDTHRSEGPPATVLRDLSDLERGSRTGPPGPGVGRTEQIAAPTVQLPVRLHSGIQTPVKLVNADPSYPAIAQSARVQGVVILEAVIDVSGRVESVRVIRSIPLLDQAAVDAVRQWRYTAATLNGSPVPVIMTITVHFKL